MKRTIFLLCFILFYQLVNAENGYDLWLRYRPINNKIYIQKYDNYFSDISILGTSETLKIVQKEIYTGIDGLFQNKVSFNNKLQKQGLIIGKIEDLPPEIFSNTISQNILTNDAFIIQSSDKKIIISAKNDIGLLYGTFHLLRLIQTQQDLENLDIREIPKTSHRLLNHWDNLDRTVERGYAGFSIWDWHKLPDFIDQRYIDYARANASIGINGTVVSNVNANALILRPQYLKKLKALADTFRPYGIKVYLTARFSAPIEIGGLKTADPLKEEVITWWENKTREIYSIIPDFGGFLVKANSEGQPGPQDYNRTHADGANLLARALAPYKGIVMWRAFVYSNDVPEDRAKQAYNEFMPLDNQFENNVFIQIKNGPIDFQAREPFHPLFGALKHTPAMMEFQITQEYLGCATHLVYLAPLFKETLSSDTYSKGKGSTVAKTIDGSLYKHELSGMAGVSNIGNDINWTGHPFGQANWYSFGRLAWNHELSAEDVAEEWLRMTFTNEQKFLNITLPMMLNSREISVNYMTPLGLHHQMAQNHHWGPGPWVSGIRADWTSTYYHKADSTGIGFNRSSTGSKATLQYHPTVSKVFDNVETCPENLLLWFHHVPWDFKMKSGNTLWLELVAKYYQGTSSVEQMIAEWEKTESFIDPERFQRVEQLLQIQLNEAIWWRNSMILYFQQFSKLEIPKQYDPPDHSLEYYQNLEFHFVPGI